MVLFHYFSFNLALRNLDQSLSVVDIKKKSKYKFDMKFETIVFFSAIEIYIDIAARILQLQKVFQKHCIISITL